MLFSKYTSTFFIPVYLYARAELFLVIHMLEMNLNSGWDKSLRMYFKHRWKHTAVVIFMQSC